MKNKLKQFWRVVVLAVVALLAGCEKEVYEDNLYQDNIHKQTITLKELQQQHPLAFTKYQKIDIECKKARQNRKNINGRFVYDSIYGFYIDTDKIVYLEKDGYKSFTFPIKREYEVEKVENLILSFITDVDYKAYIAKYELTDAEKEMIAQGETVENIKLKTSVEDFEGNHVITNGIMNRMTMVIDGECYAVDEVWQVGNTIYYTVVACSGCCITIDGGAGGGGNYNGAWPDATTVSGNPWYGEDPTSINTGNGYTAGNNGNENSGNSGGTVINTGIGNNTSTQGTPQTNPHQLGWINPHTGILTVPCVSVEDDALIYNKECILIQKLQGDDGFKSIMVTLKQAAMSWTREKLYVVYDDPTPNNQPGQVDNYDYTSSDAPVGSQTAGYTYYTNIKGVIHSHFAGYGSIFSPDDLVGLYNIINNPDISSNDFFYGVVTNDGTAYIMQIKDKQKFLAFGQKYLADDEGIRKLVNDLYARKYNITQNNSATTNEKNFLKMMKEKDMGIALSGLTFDTSAGAANTPDIFNTWNNKDYDQNSNSILNSNCN